MRRKIFNSLLALLLVSTCSLIVTLPAMADDHHVYYPESIQDAIADAANGDVVYVHEGTYDEYLLIDGVDVSLIAVGEVIIEPTTATPNSHGDTIEIYNSTTTIEGFTIIGGWGGIYTRGMSSMGDGEVNVTITNNYVTGYGKNGITANGELAYAFVKDNFVETNPDDFVAQNGIQFGWGATGQALRNTVEADWYTGEDWTACGILIFEADDVSVKQNVITDCQTGIGIESWGWLSSDSASYNQIANNVVETSTWGITITAVLWEPYTAMDVFVNNNKIVKNVVSAEAGDIGIYVGLYDILSDTFTAEVDNNKIIRNSVTGFETEILEEGVTATKIRANIITPVE